MHIVYTNSLYGSSLQPKLYKVRGHFDLCTFPKNVCAVHRGVQYTEGCPVDRGDITEYSGDIMSTPEVISTLRGYHEYTEGFHDECGEISCVHQGMFSTVGSIQIHLFSQ